MPSEKEISITELVFNLDKQLAHIMEVNLRLSKADFGEDYVPTESTVKLKTELQLLTKLEPHIKVKISSKINYQTLLYVFD